MVIHNLGQIAMHFGLLTDGGVTRDDHTHLTMAHMDLQFRVPSHLAGGAYLDIYFGAYG